MKREKNHTTTAWTAREKNYFRRRDGRETAGERVRLPTVGPPTETECGFHISNALAHSSHEYTTTTTCVWVHTTPPPVRSYKRACAEHTYPHTRDHSSARQTGHRRRSRPLSTESCPRHAVYYYYYVTPVIRNRSHSPPPLLLLLLSIIFC